MQQFDYKSTINRIAGFNSDISTITVNFFDALGRTTTNVISQLTQNGNALNPNEINTIYKDAITQQDNLLRERANIINGINELADYKIMLEYNTNKGNAGIVGAEVTSEATSASGEPAATGNIGATGTTPENITSEIMTRDLVMLYNLQYLQMFCKILGIIIIIIIFWNYFSSITGPIRLPSAITQNLPQSGTAAYNT